MQIIRGLYNCRPEHKNGVLTIGNFDGLHPGHQKIFEQLQSTAKQLNTHSCLMTFEPLPREYFSPNNCDARLMNRGEKLRGLCRLQSNIRPDAALLLNFNNTLANMSAEEFIDNILVKTLAIKAAIIGDDFRFGCDRAGDFELLQRRGKQYGFSVNRIASHHVNGKRVSSSLIREALVNDQLAEADALLGRPYTICGRINHGEKRGRTIGFPTANIHLRRPETPLHGVYSVTMHCSHGDLCGVANIGRRPTVDGERVQLEVHLFDFNKTIYGEQVCVSFQHKIRDEKKFDSFDDLKQQIKLDCDTARQLKA